MFRWQRAAGFYSSFVTFPMLRFGLPRLDTPTP
jgi:hypothetical protein